MIKAISFRQPLSSLSIFTNSAQNGQENRENSKNAPLLPSIYVKHHQLQLDASNISNLHVSHKQEPHGNDEF